MGHLVTGPQKLEWARVVERLTSSVASIVVVDLPRQADTSSVSRSLEKMGYYCTVLSLRTSDLGSFSARRRCLVGLCSRSSCEVQDLSRKQCSSPPSLTMLPLAQNPSPECRIAGVVQLEPTIMTTGDRWLPHPAGHVMVKGAKELVHHPSGPACAFVGVEHPLKGFGGTLVLEAGGTARPRSLEPKEWRLTSIWLRCSNMARTQLICTWQGSVGGNMPLPLLGSWKLFRWMERPATALILLMRKRTHKWQCGCKLRSVPPLIPKAN